MTTAAGVTFQRHDIIHVDAVARFGGYLFADPDVAHEEGRPVLRAGVARGRLGVRVAV